MIKLPVTAPEPILIRKVKLEGATRLHPTYELGTDDFGTWLYTPAGSLHRGESGGQVGWCETAQDSQGRGRPSVGLVPHDHWWVAAWIGTQLGVVCAVDIATPPVRTAAGWSFTDLELDPFRDAAGLVIIEDQDEFDQGVAAGRISAGDADLARHELDIIGGALRDQTEPYGTLGSDVLAAALATGWPPIEDRDRIAWSE